MSAALPWIAPTRTGRLSSGARSPAGRKIPATRTVPETLKGGSSPPRDSALLFIPVPEVKTVKNRVHLDLTPTGRSRDEEVARLLTVGASLVGDHRKPDGTGWVTMADLEGNEFCVERSAQERGGV